MYDNQQTMAMKPIHAIYYEMPPFIYRDGNGTLSGIIPNIAEKVRESCLIDIQFAVDAKNEQNFSSLMENPKLIENYATQEHKWIWFSLIHRFPTQTLQRLALSEYPLFQSPGVEVLVHRDQIGIFSKVCVGVSRCQYLFLTIALLTLIFGIVIWSLECLENPKFNKSLSGCGSGIWMCVVTMTTVGYGDFTPTTKCGRCLIMIWMLIAILMSAILTSTMTDAFNGIDYLDIYQQNIVARSGSPGEWIARKDYESNVHLVQDYQSLFEAVGSKEYLAGVITTDVFCYYQKMTRVMPQPLRVVKRLPKSIPVSILFSQTVSKEHDVSQFMNWCLGKQTWRDIIIEANVNDHREYIKYDTFDAGGGLDMLLTRNITIRAIAVIAAVLVSLTLVFEVLRQYRERRKVLYELKMKYMQEIGKISELEMSLFKNFHTEKVNVREKELYQWI